MNPIGIDRTPPIANGTASRSSLWRQPAAAASNQDSATVSFSDAAKALLAGAGAATGDQDMQKRLDAIQAKPAVQRTPADTEFVNDNDMRLQAIQKKSQSGGGPDALTADELSYMQKAGGFVNTMANLSSDEKALYDEMVASGNQAAADGLRQIALARDGMSGQQVTLPNGKTFDPSNTPLTGDSVRNMYKFMVVDASGQSNRAFDALATVLDQRKPS